MVEHTLRTVHESLVQGYCATADCATGDCARLRGKRYYCTTGKEKNTTSYVRNIRLLVDIILSITEQFKFVKKAVMCHFALVQGELLCAMPKSFQMSKLPPTSC